MSVSVAWSAAMAKHLVPCRGSSQDFGGEGFILTERNEGQRSTIFLQNFFTDPQNREAFGRFAAKYLPRIKGCCKKWRLQDADAEDLAASILLGFLGGDVLSRF